MAPLGFMRCTRRHSFASLSFAHLLLVTAGTLAVTLSPIAADSGGVVAGGTSETGSQRQARTGAGLATRDAPAGSTTSATAAAATASDASQSPAEMEERGLRDSIKRISDTVSVLPNLGKMVNSVNVTEIARASTKVARELSKSLRMDVFAAGKALAAAGAALGSVVFLGGLAGMLATGLGMFRYSPELYDSAYFSNRVGPAYPGTSGLGGTGGGGLLSSLTGSLPSLSDAQALLYQKIQQAQQKYIASHGGGPATIGLQRNENNGPAVPGVVSAVPIHVVATGPGASALHHFQHQQQQQQRYSGQQAGGQGAAEYYGERPGQQQQQQQRSGLSARDARILRETKRPYNEDLLPALQDLFSAITNSVEKAAPELMEALRRRRRR